MARRLRAAGHPLNVFARRAEVSEEAHGLGAVPVASLAALGESSDVAIVCVYTDDQVREVALGPKGIVGHLRPGTVLVNHTTGRPATARALAAAARARDVSMLDCALSGGPAAVDAGNLTLLVGGDPDVLERITPVLASYSSPILHVGDVGDGQKVKLLNNGLFGAHVALTIRAERCATEMGLDPALALRGIHESSGDSYALGAAVDLGSAARLAELGGRFIRKDVAVVADVAGELGVDLGPILDAAREV
jgi:3-hydroxyisobutyrate dehydrogenase-like beta-hydroxyacid dehydrogenase